MLVAKALGELKLEVKTAMDEAERNRLEKARERDVPICGASQGRCGTRHG